MIHAYNEQFLEIAKEKIALMFEIAVNVEKIKIDDFFSKFISSKICAAFEKGDPVYVLGKSASELLAIVLDKDPVDIELSDYATPEYWVGDVLAFTQWYLNKSYRKLGDIICCSELVEKYFPYHEMDIMHTVNLFQTREGYQNKLKMYRKKKGLSQRDLSVLSGVPERTIRSYEQGQNDILKAQAGTLYDLANVLNCNIEDLLQ